jgi:hypothetical protein
MQFGPIHWIARVLSNRWTANKGLSPARDQLWPSGGTGRGRSW